VFEKQFKVSLDEDYSLHDPPSQDEVKNFALGRGTKHNAEDLRIDMRGKISSAWNQEVTEILLAELKKKDFEGMPKRSEVYLADMIETKLERVRAFWRNTQPRIKETGELETIIEVEKRMVEGKEDCGKVGQANSQCKSMSNSIY